MTTENQGNPPPLPAEERARAESRIAHRQADMEALIAAETELECISDVATGCRPASDFQPADPETVLGQVLHALAAAYRAGHLAGQRAGLDAVVNLCGDWCAEEGCPCEPASIARAIRRLPLADPPPYEGKESKNG